MDHSQFYNDYYYFPTPVMNTEGNHLVPILCHNNDAPSFNVVSPESDISAATLPEVLGFPEDVVSFSDYNHLCFNGSIGGQLHQSFGDQECSKPLGLAGQENWGFGIRVPEHQSMNMKVGRYSGEERKERIERYLKKRHQRNFNKTIKYACRKSLADRRVRVRGRFARNNGNDQQINHEDSTHQEIAQNKIEYNYDYHNGDVQIKYDEDDWLQEAMASLAYLPYVTAGLEI